VTLLLTIACLVAVILTSAASPSAGSSGLALAATVSPEKLIRVVVSLDQSQPASKIEELTSGLRVEELFSGFEAADSAYVGGFVLATDQSVDAALAAYQEMQVADVATALQAATSSDSADGLSGLQSYVGDLKAYLASLTVDGLGVFGFIAIGPADLLQAKLQGPWQGFARAADLSADPEARPAAPWEDLP
jgi:hypothetical protein